MTGFGLRTVATYQVRRADADIDKVVELISALLADGVQLIDLRRYDDLGTYFEVRANPKDCP